MPTLFEVRYVSILSVLSFIHPLTTWYSSVIPLIKGGGCLCPLYVPQCVNLAFSLSVVIFLVYVCYAYVTHLLFVHDAVSPLCYNLIHFI